MTSAGAVAILWHRRIRSPAVSFALQLFDLVGIFVFALSGGVLAVRQRLDLFGVLVLACATAVTGGIVRDVLIGAIPPASLADWRYLATAMLAGVGALAPAAGIGAASSQTTVNPAAAFIGEVGDRQVVGYYMAEAGACAVTMMMADPATEEVSKELGEKVKQTLANDLRQVFTDALRSAIPVSRDDSIWQSSIELSAQQ